VTQLFDLVAIHKKTHAAQLPLARNHLSFAQQVKRGVGPTTFIDSLTLATQRVHEPRTSHFSQPSNLPAKREIESIAVAIVGCWA
jgi:hypothetical protein